MKRRAPRQSPASQTCWAAAPSRRRGGAGARRHRTEGLEQADLLQEGIVGLLRALQRFDPARRPGRGFETWWTKQSLQEGRGDFIRPLCLPPKALSQLSQLKPSASAATSASDGSAKVVELAERTSIVLGQAEAVVAACLILRTIWTVPEARNEPGPSLVCERCGKALRACQHGMLDEQGDSYRRGSIPQ